MKTKHSFFKRNGLSIVVLFLMLLSLIGQFVTGFHEKNRKLIEDGSLPITATQLYYPYSSGIRDLRNRNLLTRLTMKQATSINSSYVKY